MDIVERGVYYLRGKGKLPISTPFLITHCLEPSLASRFPFAATWLGAGTRC